jgi:hypothetical protein
LIESLFDSFHDGTGMQGQITNDRESRAARIDNAPAQASLLFVQAKGEAKSGG